MKKKQLIILLLLANFLFVILAACNTPQESETPPANVVTGDFVPVVSATGEIVPKQFAWLSVKTGGVVAEVLAKEGDQVNAGDVLLELEGTEQLQAAVSAAHFELVNAQVSLDALYENTDLLAAQALQAKDQAERALDDALDAELQQALALKAIADAQKAVESTQRRYNTVISTASQADIDAASAQVVLAKDALDKAKEDFEPYEEKPEDNLVRANFQSKLAAAQSSYDAAVRRLNALKGTGSEADIAVAKADLATAQAQVTAAE